jgi:hypothetical protein
VPDIQEIVRHVTLSVGTSAFGVPRVLEGNRPRYPALACLKQLWPQILPIVQRFSRKPMQIPVLFGIALQRALEYTKDKLDPTLGASIAMECAVAMSRVVLPETAAAPASVQPAAAAGSTVSTSTSGTWAALTKGAPEKATPPNVTPALADFASKLLEPSRARGTKSPPVGEPRSRRSRKLAALEESGTLPIRAFVARIPPAARMVTIASAAFIAIAGAMYGGEADEPVNEVRQLVASAPEPIASVPEEGAPAFAQVEEATPEEAAFFAQESAPASNFIPAVQNVEQAPVDDDIVPRRGPNDDEPSADYAALPSQQDNSEGLMMDEFGQPMQ